MFDSRSKLKQDATVLKILHPSSAFLCLDLRNGVLTSSGILFLTAFLWFWPYSPGDTVQATFTWIMMIIHAAIGVGGFLAVFEHLNLETYARVACMLWIVVWVFMLVQIGTREDICEDQSNADSFEDCKDFLYTSRLISILSWTFVGGYHHLLVSGYHHYLQGPARKKRMSTQFHKEQRKKKRSQASSLGVGPSKDLSGYWESAPHGYTFRLEHSQSKEPGLYDVYNDSQEMWAHVKYLGPLLGHELQLTYSDSHGHGEIVHGQMKMAHGLSMNWSDGDTWKQSTPHGFGGTHAPDSHHQAHHDSHHVEPKHDDHHGGHHSSGDHARHHSDHGHHSGADHHGDHGGHAAGDHGGHAGGHHDSHHSPRHGGHHDSNHDNHDGEHHDSHGHHSGKHPSHHSDDEHHSPRHGGHHDSHHDNHDGGHHDSHGHHSGKHPSHHADDEHHKPRHDSHHPDDHRGGHNDHHEHHSKGGHHDDHHGERHASDHEHHDDHGDHDHPLTGNWDTKYGYVFRLEFDRHDMYEVFNEENEMWATVKHHQEKNGNVPFNAVTLVYTESASQRVSGHYAHGILHWNDGDTWEKNSKPHGGHPHDGHDSHHEETEVANTDTPEPPPVPSNPPPTSKEQSKFLVVDRRGSFHKQQPSTGDPFLIDKEDETVSPSKTPARTSTHPSY